MWPMWRGPLAYGQATQMRILSWPLTPSSMRDDKSNLASYAFAERRQDRRGGTPKDLLVHLRQLPGNRHLALWQHLGQDGQRTPQAVRRFEHDGRPRRVP